MTRCRAMSLLVFLRLLFSNKIKPHVWYMVFEYTICIRHTAGYIPNNSRISACAYANK
jgi:hypothetical protein